MKYILSFLMVFIFLSAHSESEGSKIISDFTDVFSAEVFLQGFAFTICLSLGLFLIITDQRDYFRGVENFKSYTQQLKLLVKNYLNKISLRSHLESNQKNTNENELGFHLIVIARTIGVAFVFLFLVIISGVIINTTSDKWMRLDSGYHLGLKDFWRFKDLKKIEENYNIDTYEAAKIQAFRKIYDDLEVEKMELLTPRELKLINELYYQSWHQLISDEKWRDYLMQTHNMVDLTEAFSLSFFILLSLAYINFLINIVRDFFSKWRESSLVIFTPLLIFLGFSIASFQFGGSLWSAVPFVAFPLICQLIIAFKYSNTQTPDNHSKSISSYYSLTSIIIIYISCSCYIFTSLAYVENSRLLVKKTFGVYRYSDNVLKAITRRNFQEIIKYDTTRQMKQVKADSLKKHSLKTD